jgi:SAM-dependent methyltransferase
MNRESSRKLWNNVWKNTNIDRPIHHIMIDNIQTHMQSSSRISLEVGCGSGVDSAFLSKIGYFSVGLDYSITALQHIKQGSEDNLNNVIKVAGDTYNLPFNSNSFDLVFSQGLMEHFANMKPALLEQKRILKPGGLICVDVPQTWNLATINKRIHIKRGTWFAGWETNYSLSQLEKFLETCGFRIVSSYGWLYFPSFLNGFRNLHTLDERHNIPIYLSKRIKNQIERFWLWLENQRWYYKWLGCIGVLGIK